MAAAKELARGRRWRGSVSRSYYAAYSVVAGELEGKASYPRGLKNPPHEALPRLIMNHLTQLSVRERGRLGHLLVRLLDNRIDADYRPGRTVDRGTALDSLGLSLDALRLLGVL